MTWVKIPVLVAHTKAELEHLQTLGAAKAIVTPEDYPTKEQLEKSDDDSTSKNEDLEKA